MKTGNIAVISATFLIVLKRVMLMTNEQYERERRYRLAISVAISMLKQGVICEEEYRIINERMIEKHKPFFGGLVSLIELIS